MLLKCASNDKRFVIEEAQRALQVGVGPVTKASQCGREAHNVSARGRQCCANAHGRSFGGLHGRAVWVLPGQELCSALGGLARQEREASLATLAAWVPRAPAPAARCRPLPRGAQTLAESLTPEKFLGLAIPYLEQHKNPKVRGKAAGATVAAVERMQVSRAGGRAGGPCAGAWLAQAIDRRQAPAGAG